MGSQKSPGPLSPTVIQVIDEFVGVMQADDAIDNDAACRLEVLLRKGVVSKPEEIHAALFDAPEQGQT